jgi:hypothetical protein
MVNVEWQWTIYRLQLCLCRLNYVDSDDNCWTAKIMSWDFAYYYLEVRTNTLNYSEVVHKNHNPDSISITMYVVSLISPKKAKNKIM